MVACALAVVQRVLRNEVQAGYQTPATVYGAELVMACAGVTREDVEENAPRRVRIGASRQNELVQANTTRPSRKSAIPTRPPKPCRPLRIRRRRPLPTSVARQCRRLQHASLTGGREDRDLDTETQAQPIAFVLQIVTRLHVEPELRGGAEVSTESHSNARRNRRCPPSPPRAPAGHTLSTSRETFQS